MAQTVANLVDVMKEVWTQDRLEKQYYDQNPLLSKIEKTNRFTIGEKAFVPLQKGRGGGYGAKPAAGGTLNAADEARVDRAEYDITFHYKYISIENAALEQASGNKAHAVVGALNLEVENALSALRKQLTRQAYSNGDALIAECTTTSSSTTVNLVSTGYGYDAIVRGWLEPGLLVDIGTTANEGSEATDREITSVSESSSDPEIVISGAAVDTAAGDYVSIANNRSGTTSYETNGLRQIAGSTTSAVGGLDPDTTGEEFWKPAQVDTSTTVVSLDLLLSLQNSIFQKTGKASGQYVTTSGKQRKNIYSLLQNQARFTGDSGFEAGSVESVRWNGMVIEAQPDCPDRELYMLSLEDFFIVTGASGKPQWMSDRQGANTGLIWNAGSTNFVDALNYNLNVAIRRRNSHAAAVALTA